MFSFSLGKYHYSIFWIGFSRVTRYPYRGWVSCYYSNSVFDAARKSFLSYDFEYAIDFDDILYSDPQNGVSISFLDFFVNAMVRSIHATSSADSTVYSFHFIDQYIDILYHADFRVYIDGYGNWHRASFRELVLIILDTGYISHTCDLSRLNGFVSAPCYTSVRDFAEARYSKHEVISSCLFICFSFRNPYLCSYLQSLSVSLSLSLSVSLSISGCKDRLLSNTNQRKVRLLSIY